jgi:5-formyltetrahydrofolate cyclo-ligase
MSNALSGDNNDDSNQGQFASPPCFMHELDPTYGGTPVDRDQARDVARWRKSERERLIAARLALSIEERTDNARGIAADLDTIIPFAATTIVSVYWPFRGEPDLRGWMAALHAKAIRVALPVVISKGQPLVFREWHPAARLERGVWNIPFPADGAIVVPTVMIAPLVGFDPNCYRLGYGGGFFDRTLAALDPRPLVIGVGHPIGAIKTIYSQPHDIPMDWIVTGCAPSRLRQANTRTFP